jgi:hypothetical protein
MAELIDGLNYLNGLNDLNQLRAAFTPLLHQAIFAL